MANYLSGITAVSQIATGNLGSNSLVGNLGFNAALNFTGAGSAISPVIAAAGGVSNALAFLGLGSGSKPKALHTEYASGSANWAKPYGSGTDIVFYLQRADGGGESSSGAPAGAGTGVLPSPAGGSSPSLTGEPTPVGGGVEPARVRADVQAGPGLPSSLQTPLNQIASASTIAGSVSTVAATSSGLMGPLTGLTEGLAVGPGGTSQALSALTSRVSAVANATASARAFSKRPTRSLPGSEAFFSQTLLKSFNPAASFDTLGTVASIEDALERAPTAELSAAMAIFSGGIASTSDLIESINYGRVGFSTSGSAAEANRLGPQGLTQRFAR